MNKVIAAMMLMAITTAMPAMAVNKKPNNGKNDKAVVVNNHKTDSHFDRNEKTLPHLSAHKTHAYRPDVKSCKFVLSRRDYQKNVRAKVENMKGVMDTKWNPRTHELTVIYDAKVTSARHIKHFMA
jgi:hypothetical protein